MLYAIIGSSGSGKTTVGQMVFGKENELTSFTTRPIREGEVDGVDYHFISKQEFNDLLESNSLAEYTEYAGNYYGLTLDEIESKTKESDCYVVVDYNGYEQLTEQVEDLRSVFVYATLENVVSRLLVRGESHDFINKRLKLYEEENSLMDKVDYVIDNNFSTKKSVNTFKKILKEKR